MSNELKGKERYKSGVIPYKKMGYWDPDCQFGKIQRNGA